MDGQSLCFGIATMFGSAVLSHSGKYKMQQWLLSAFAILFFLLAVFWGKINPMFGTDFNQGINYVASNAWVWLSMIALTWTYLVFVLHSQSVVEIASPSKDTEVDWQADVSGLVRPPDSFVQVFVLSHDGKWYPHEASVAGSAWTVQRLRIGDKEPPSDRNYKLVAISGAKKLTERTENLPHGEARSRFINVRRKV